MTERMRHDEVKIKFSAAYDAKCDNCGKRKQYLHQVTTPHWTKFFCDKCGSWFVTANAIAHNKEIENNAIEVKVQGSLPDGGNYVD